MHKHTFSISVEVIDAKALHAAAMAAHEARNGSAAREDALTLFGTEDAPNVRACVVRLIGQSQLPGCEIPAQ